MAQVQVGQARPGASHDMRKCWSAMDKPFVTLHEEIDIPWLHESLDSVKVMCKKIVPRWASIPLDQLRVAKISGGITNILFSVTPVSSDGDSGMGHDPVIVRIFGPMTEMVIDRGREMKAMQALSDGGFGAHLIGRFGNGVVQSFIRAHTLTTQEMRSSQMIPLIAESLARFHSLHVPGPREPQLWPTIHKYLGLAQGLQFEEPEKQAQHAAIDFERLRSNINDVQTAAEALDSPVVFSHNDLLAGNIMYERDTGQLHLIDFEYSAYGYRGYDIANHFCEYAGFECDYSRSPDRGQQDLFFRHYLRPRDPHMVSPAELDNLAQEVSLFTLASHLYWAVWAIIQARYSPIAFDYMGYFHLRYSQFMHLKAGALDAAKVHRAQGENGNAEAPAQGLAPNQNGHPNA